MYIIVGTGGHANSVISTIYFNQPILKSKLVVCDPYSPIPIRESVMGNKVYGNNHLATLNMPLVLAIGSNAERFTLASSFKHRHFPSIVNKSAFVDPSAIIGEGCFIGNSAYIGPNVVINSFSIINSRAIIEHDASVGFCSHVAPNATILGSCEVGDHCLVGASSTLLPTITLASFVTVGAGSVVISDHLKEHSTIIGSPAQSRN